MTKAERILAVAAFDEIASLRRNLRSIELDMMASAFGMDERDEGFVEAMNAVRPSLDKTFAKLFALLRANTGQAQAMVDDEVEARAEQIAEERRRSAEQRNGRKLEL